MVRCPLSSTTIHPASQAPVVDDGGGLHHAHIYEEFQKSEVDFAPQEDEIVDLDSI